MALALVSTTGVAVLAVLAQATDLPALRDAALALAVVAALTVAVRIVGERQGERLEDDIADPPARPSE